MASNYAVVSPFPQTNGTINRMLIYKGVLYIGGSFSSVNGQPRQSFAAIDPVTGILLPLVLTPALSASTAVNDFVILNDIIYMTGTFLTPRLKAASYDLTGALLPWNPILDTDGITIATDGSQIFIGGIFTVVNGGVFRNRLASFDLVAGTVSSWDPDINNGVNEIKIIGNDVYVAGFFNTVNGGTTRNYAAAFDKTSGIVNGWNPDFNSPALTLESFSGLIYVGGFFSQLNAGSVSRQGIAAVDPTTGAAYLPFNAGAGYSGVFRIKERSNQLLVGGFINPIPLQTGFAILNPSDGSLLLPKVNLDGGVYDMERLGTRFFIGGPFGAVLGEVTRSNLASFILATNSLKPLNVTFDGPVRGVHLIGGVLYVFGAFTSVTGNNGTFTRNHGVSIDPATNDILSFDPDIDGSVLTSIAIGTTIYIGGQFSNVGGNPRSRAAAIDTTGSVLAWDPDFSGSGNRVQAMAFNGVSLYIGGTFTALNGGAVLRNNVVEVDLVSGTADPTWDPNPDGQILAMVSGSLGLYLSGNFVNIGGEARVGLAKISPIGTGAADPAWIFDLDASGTARALTIGSTNELYLAGNITSVNGTPQAFFTKITSAPALDPTWSDGLDIDGPGTGILAFMGTVFVGGSFQHVGGEFRPVASSVTSGGVLGNFGPAFGPSGGEADGFMIDFPGNTHYVFGSFLYIGVVEADFLLALDIPAPPPIGLPQAPVIEFLNRKSVAGEPTLTLFKWKPVFKDEQNNYITVDGYRIYRTQSLNLEDPVLIAEITSLDIRGFVDTMFTEEIDGFYKYCVSAFNGTGEGGKSCSAAVGLAQSDRI